MLILPLSTGTRVSFGKINSTSKAPFVTVDCPLKSVSPKVEKSNIYKSPPPSAVPLFPKVERSMRLSKIVVVNFPL